LYTVLQEHLPDSNSDDDQTQSGGEEEDFLPAKKKAKKRVSTLLSLSLFRLNLFRLSFSSLLDVGICVLVCLVFLL
jgi:hypothetical protein